MRASLLGSSNEKDGVAIPGVRRTAQEWVLGGPENQEFFSDMLNLRHTFDIHLEAWRRQVDVLCWG